MGNQGWEKVSTESWASTEYLAMPNLEPLALEGRTHHRASSHRDQRQLICPQLSYPSKVHLVKAMVVMYGCESWTIKKAECWRIDALELWCWRRLLRVPWTARRSNQSILKETSPEYWNVPDILECEVKWALWSITMNKTSGGDGIPVELFQILKDGAVKVLHSTSQQIWKTQQWPQDWKRSVFIPIPKKGNAKECSNYCTITLISHASKVMLKILQARLQQYVNWELPDVQAGFRKGRGTRDQIANICWIIEKAREF